MSFELQLAHGYVAHVDQEDARRVSMHRWRMRLSGRPYVTASIKVDGKFRTVLLHRFILGAAEGQIVDHVDGNPLNNTRANLRLATSAQNAANRLCQTGRFIGVRSVSGGFSAMVCPAGMDIHLGVFETAEVAAAAYNAAAEAAFGEFASTNPVEPVDGLLEAAIEMKRQAIERLQREVAILEGGA